MLQLLQWDGNVPMTHHCFIMVITPQGSSLTHLHLIGPTLSPVTFIMRLLFTFSFSFLKHLKTSMLVVQLNCLTCTTGSKALNASYAAPVCYANRSVLMKASWIIQEWCSTTNTPQEQILRKKKEKGLLWKNKKWSISGFRFISTTAHHFLINKCQQMEITHLTAL